MHGTGKVLELQILKIDRTKNEVTLYHIDSGRTYTKPINPGDELTVNEFIQVMDYTVTIVPLAY